MDLLLIILAFALIILGFIGAMLPVIPGPILAYAGLWLGQWSGMANFSTLFLSIMTVVTVIVIVSDYFFPAIITRRFGGTKEASWGALIGSLVGIFLTPIGMILGMILGAFIGQAISNNAIAHPLKAALGSFLGFLVGTGIKMLFAAFALWSLIDMLIS